MNRRRATVPLAAAVICGLGLPITALAQAPACTAVTTATLNIAGAVVTGATLAEPDKGLPQHCIVTGAVNERTGVDGKHYAITFEMRLPTQWNGRFLHQVNGGNDGVVVPALGDNPAALASGGTPALARGFAVLSSDSGHSGSDPANKDLGLAGAAAFGFDPQARRDYGYAADMTLAPIAKALIAAHYGKKPEFSYMYGCSNGGRHAMVAASRMPEAYDGFLVGNPGFNLPKAALQHAWDVKNLSTVDQDVRKSLTREDGKLISSKITETCDALDGVKDGITANLAACQKAFDFQSLQCAPGATESCLSAAKVTALKAIFAGPRNTKGEVLYSDWSPDGGVGQGNWRFWKVESPIPAWGNQSAIATMGAASLAQIFVSPPVKLEGGNDGLIASLRKFDFDTDAPKIFATDSTFTESAMDYMTPPDAANPQLTGMKAAKHEMIVFHGQSDPVFSVNDTINWYAKLNANSGGKASDAARLFTLPGITHCGGGIGLEKFDALTALTDWVEKGNAPEQIIASANPANKDLPADWSPGRTRPLCPWPKFAKYNSGDVESAGSFACAIP